MLYKNSTKKTATEAMDTASKLQDPRATARWHNIWLGTALFFLVTTVTFAGVFGWAFTQWKDDDACHEYYASLTHIPTMNDSLPTATLLFYDDELHYRKGAAYDESSCEGKLVNQLVVKGNVLDVQEGPYRRRALQENKLVTEVGTAYSLVQPGKDKSGIPWKGGADCSCVKSNIYENEFQVNTTTGPRPARTTTFNYETPALDLLVQVGKTSLCKGPIKDVFQLKCGYFHLAVPRGNVPASTLYATTLTCQNSHWKPVVIQDSQWYTCVSRDRDPYGR